MKHARQVRLIECKRKGEAVPHSWLIAKLALRLGVPAAVSDDVNGEPLFQGLAHSLAPEEARPLKGRTSPVDFVAQARGLRRSSGREAASSGCVARERTRVRRPSGQTFGRKPSGLLPALFPLTVRCHGDPQSSDIG
jgi:hypothetical protein